MSRGSDHPVHTFCMVAGLVHHRPGGCPVRAIDEPTPIVPSGTIVPVPTRSKSNDGEAVCARRLRAVGCEYDACAVVRQELHNRSGHPHAIAEAASVACLGHRAPWVVVVDAHPAVLAVQWGEAVPKLIQTFSLIVARAKHPRTR